MRYMACLETKVGRTRAEVAVMFGVSRARVSQYLNLLKLPRVIVAFLADCQIPAILHHFTERRLRRLTAPFSPEEKLRAFKEMIHKVGRKTPTTGVGGYPPC
jgi:hypothetical protein